MEQEGKKQHDQDYKRIVDKMGTQTATETKHRLPVSLRPDMLNTWTRQQQTGHKDGNRPERKQEPRTRNILEVASFQKLNILIL